METKKIRIIIAGSRGYDNYAFLKQRVLEILKQKNLTIDQIIIVSGTASGADKLGERFAMEMGADLEQHPANWSLGKSAGYIRNKEMADISQICIIFWDGSSPGSKHMYDLAMKKGLDTYLIDMSKTLANRLTKARKYIEQAVIENNCDNLLKYAKNFRDLYAECFSAWAENNFHDMIEYSEAEYLKYLIMYSFGQMFDYNNSLTSLAEIVRQHAKECNIISII